MRTRSPGCAKCWWIDLVDDKKGSACSNPDPSHAGEWIIIHPSQLPEQRNKQRDDLYREFMVACDLARRRLAGETSWPKKSGRTPKPKYPSTPLQRLYHSFLDSCGGKTYLPEAIEFTAWKKKIVETPPNG